jgi:hypothetical protein
VVVEIHKSNKSKMRFMLYCKDMKTDMRKNRRRLFPYLSPKMLKLFHRAGLLTYEPDIASSHSE